MRTTLRLHRTEKAGILPRVFLLLAVLLFAAAGIFAAPPAQAAGAQQIRDAKLKWVTTDYDGIPERLLLKKEYDSGDTFSVQYQMDIVLTGAETHAPGTIRITAPNETRMTLTSALQAEENADLEGRMKAYLGD